MPTESLIKMDDITSALDSTVLDKKERIVIALDFGTTYSGVAYCFCNSGKKPDVRPVVDWVGT